MATNFFFLSLTIIILSREAPTGENIDVFLQPLYEELLELWKGMDAVDSNPQQETRNFKLRGLLLWAVSDFPTYGLISGQ
jgi:hypothetical protein